MADEQGRDGWADYLAREVERGRRAAESFPFELVETTGEQALETWRALKAQREGAPLVLGGPGDLYRIANRRELWRESGRTADAALAAADQVRFPEDLFRLREEEDARAAAYWRRERDEGRELHFDPDKEWPPTGDWPDEPYKEEPLCTASQWDFERDLDLPGPARRVPLAHVYITVLPTSDATEAPAHFLWGGWNEVPQSEILVAALRSWRTRYGAELIGLSHDTWSLRVDRRPQDRAEAEALAREMVALCGDMLGEVHTLQGQAALVMANDWWNFWWD